MSRRNTSRPTIVTGSFAPSPAIAATGGSPPLGGAPSRAGSNAANSAISCVRSVRGVYGSIPASRSRATFSNRIRVCSGKPSPMCMSLIAPSGVVSRVS